jgi:class 3 adenylate cyclase
MSDATLEKRIEGSPATRFFQEFFGNSAQFPIANILLELLLEGPVRYLAAPDAYALTLAALVQTRFLSRWQNGENPRRFWGNLIGAALYTAIEIGIEGTDFFASPNHLAYWGFAAAIGLLQSIRPAMPHVLRGPVQVIEDVVRASILLVMYIIFESATGGLTQDGFFADSSHRFVALATLLLGLSLGLADLTARRYLQLLRETAGQLRTYSEWLLGRELLEKSMHDPESLTLRRHQRTVLFMDIRGFTAWSETRGPEEVVEMLNRYYHAAETTLAGTPVVKSKFTADEMMVVFPGPAQAVPAARKLRREISQLLAGHGLGAGIALHSGPLVEGLLGSMGVKFYDVIGDTVNTAERIEGAAAAGEVLISADVAAVLATEELGLKRQIAVKGKEIPIEVYPLLD